ncbi:tripartite tricarboxylate transporter substrate binding protein [Desulfobacula sp.]|uniref:tripartite tricarboxylate transporter substrate binding protein n=1 Tax=Desulfobacula sp. TaxID=2593537 RepID=UPI00261C9D0E|nr:tripartite tricarboxylate transporter substrate binding protein [Desulfobacula sp.]
MKARSLTRLFCSIIVGLFTLTTVIVLSEAPACAEFPQKTITLIVPWSPGGSGDMTCRILAAQMEKDLGESVVVKNMPGAGSMVGATALADAKPDGYTLGFLGISAAIAQYTSVSPVMMNTYKAVSGVINPSLFLLTSTKTPWKTLQEFVAFAKANPGKIKNGNAGAGVIDHLYSSEFAKVAKVQFTQVPYKGWGPSLAALAGGHIDSMFVAVGPAKSMIAAGKIRPVAIAAEKRHPSYPDIPTMKEGGVDITMPFWESIVVPAETPDTVVAILDRAIGKAFADPATKKKIKDSGLDVSYLDTAGIASLRRSSDATVKNIVESLGLKQN